MRHDLGDKRGLRIRLFTSIASLRLRLWGSRFRVFMYSFSLVVSPCKFRHGLLHS